MGLFISGISAILNSNWLNQADAGVPNARVHNNNQQFQQEFQQLGQDLQSGNLSAAQQDFGTLEQLGSQGNAASASQSNNPIAQELNQLRQDLQSGNLSAAESDYNQIQQAFQSQTSQGLHHHHHHHGGGSGSNQIAQLLNQLGQDLQSNNISGAQQVYATLQQDFQQLGLNTGQTATPQPSQPTSSTISLMA